MFLKSKSIIKAGMLTTILSAAVFWGCSNNSGTSGGSSSEVTPPAPQATDVSENITNYGNVRYVNSTGTGVLNLRAEPSANAALLFAIPHGAAVDIDTSGGTGQWVRARYKSMTGFVNQRFLSDTPRANPILAKYNLSWGANIQTVSDAFVRGWRGNNSLGERQLGGPAGVRTFCPNGSGDECFHFFHDKLYRVDDWDNANERQISFIDPNAEILPAR